MGSGVRSSTLSINHNKLLWQALTAMTGREVWVIWNMSFKYKDWGLWPDECNKMYMFSWHSIRGLTASWLSRVADRFILPFKKRQRCIRWCIAEAPDILTSHTGLTFFMYIRVVLQDCKYVNYDYRGGGSRGSPTQTVLIKLMFRTMKCVPLFCVKSYETLYKKKLVSF